MNTQSDLQSKPLTRALISIAVRSLDPATSISVAPTHQELLQHGITRAAHDITEKALLLLGKGPVLFDGGLSEDAPVSIGFSLFIMLGIVQVVSKEGSSVDVSRLTEELIELHLHRKISAAGSTDTEKKLLDIARIATEIPQQIVETARGEVEELFSKCYAVLPGFLLGNDEARAGLMPIFGTALHILLQAQVQPEG